MSTTPFDFHAMVARDCIANAETCFAAMQAKQRDRHSLPGRLSLLATVDFIRGISWARAARKNLALAEAALCAEQKWARPSPHELPIAAGRGDT